MAFPERVQTERLIASKPLLADGDAWAAIMSAPEIDEEAWPAAQRPPERIRAVAARTIAHWDAHRFGAWSVQERGEDEVVGRVGLAYAMKEGIPVVEVGWWVAPACWGRGYATEIARAAVDLARDELGLRELWSWTTPANGASQAVMAKLGLHEERRIVYAGLEHIAYRRAL